MDLSVGGHGEVREAPERASTSSFLPLVSSLSSLNLPIGPGCEDHWSWDGSDKSDHVRLCGSKHRVAHFHPDRRGQYCHTNRPGELTI